MNKNGYEKGIKRIGIGVGKAMPIERGLGREYCSTIPLDYVSSWYKLSN